MSMVEPARPTVADVDAYLTSPSPPLSAAPTPLPGRSHGQRDALSWLLAHHGDQPHASLSPDHTVGVVTAEITSPLFRVPTTVAEFGSRLYAVNARFGTPPGPDVDYDVVRVQK
jgi:hypothetical protein